MQKKRALAGLVAGVGLAAVVTAALSGSAGITNAGASLNLPTRPGAASPLGASLN